MDDAKFQEFLEAVFSTMKFASKPTAPAYVCYASRTHREFENALNENSYGVRCQIIWVKPVANMSWANYRWKHEPILYAVPDGKSVQFYGDRKQYTHWEFKPSDVELLNWAKSLLTEEEEDDTSVWKIGRENVMGYEHPTSKPVKLPAKAILNSSRTGETVLDLFAGGVQLLSLANRLVGFAEQWSLTSDMSMWCASAMLALLVARTIGKRRHQR